MKRRELRALTICDLAVLYDAMIRARDAVWSVANQPRGDGAVSELLDDEAERLAITAQDIAKELSRRTPGNDDEVGAFARVAIDWNVFQCGDGNEHVVLSAALKVLATTPQK